MKKMIFDVRLNNSILYSLTETTTETFIQDVTLTFGRLVQWGSISKDIPVGNFLNALALSYQCFPEGGQVTFGELSIQYGEAVKSIIPNYIYDDHAALVEDAKDAYQEKLDDGELNPDTTFDEFFSTYEGADFRFEPVREGFIEFLETYIGKSFMYNHSDYREALEFVLLDDTDSLDEFIGNLNSWTTKGYRYNDSFSFYGNSILATVDLTYSNGYYRDEVFEQQNKSYIEILQKVAALHIERSGYSFKNYFGPYSFAAGMVFDYYYYSRNEFFKIYFDDYGYVDALSLKLEDLSQEKQDLAYCLVCTCLELSTERLEEIEQRYSPKVA